MARLFGRDARRDAGRAATPAARLRRFDDLGEIERACALVVAREAMLAAYGGGLPWREQQTLLAAYLRRQGILYTPPVTDPQDGPA
ncbi:hypothetical protein [Azospirillum sp. ST 5-10]|uniref:hypothetical protein n=1 Tax=unclassified Azospirillum TaxID=2630922 RepID=UPI003F49FDAB